MSKIDELIKKYCPNGVEYKQLWEVTSWDKKFNSVDKTKQPKVYKYKYFLASDLKPLIVEDGDVKVLTTNVSKLYTTEELVDGDYYEAEIIAIPWGGNPIVQYYNGKFITSDNRIAISNDINILNTKFLFHYLNFNLDVIASFYRGAGIKHPNMSKVLDFQIPVPPLPIQEEIVRILDSFTSLEAELEAELEARMRQYEYYRNELLSFEGKEVEWKTLGEIGEVKMCKRIFKHETNEEGGIPFYKIGTFGKEPNAFISNDLFEEYKRRFSYPNVGTILISASGTIGRAVIYQGEEAYYQDSNIVWVENDETLILNKFLFHYYKVIKWQVDTGGVISRLYNDNIRKAKIPVPPLSKQQRIVDVLDKFDKLVNDISEGLPAEIQARRQQYEHYRGQLLNFTPVS